MHKILNWLNQTTPPYGLAIFRILFGIILLWDLLRIKRIGLIDSFFPRGIIFPYEFNPLPLLPQEGLNLLLIVLMISSIGITLGYFYKQAMILFSMGFTYFFLLDQTLYNNHLYMICLLSFIMIFLPADAALSVQKKNYSSTIPQWGYRLLQFQIIVVFFYGAIAKLNPYWFDLHPVQEILSSRAKASSLSFLTNHSTQLIIAYGGFLFDLLIGPMLLSKRFRFLGIIGAIVFNISNAYIFDDIYIFPFFMIGALVLFLDQEKLAQQVQKLPFASSTIPQNHPSKKLKKNGLLLIGFFVIIQLTLPLRHYFMDGYTDWTGEGQRFAWRMKIQTRKVEEVKFAIFDLDNKTIYPIKPETYLYPDEINKMCYSPQMILQFCQFLKTTVAKKQNIKNLMIKSKVKVRFNGLPATYIFDPSLDLLEKIQSNQKVNQYIIPLSQAGIALKPDPNGIPW